MSDPRLAAVSDGAEATAVATYTRRSTDEEHQRFSIEMQDDRLDKYVGSQESWHLTTPTRTTSPAPPWTARACSASCAMRGRDVSPCCSSTGSIASRAAFEGSVHILDEFGQGGSRLSQRHRTIRNGYAGLVE